MRSLLRNWSLVVERLSQVKTVLICFDYDGTLTPIIDSPELALLPEETRELLRSLSRQPRYSLAVVSGRSLSEVKSFVGLNELIYAGNHGLELAGTHIRFVHPSAQKARPVIKKSAARLRRGLAEIDGVFIEDKGLSLTIHFRQVRPEMLDRTLKIVENIIRGPADRNEIKISSGKKVIEVRPPVDWDKGKIINLIIEKIKKREISDTLLTIYTGDDRTDEDAFRAIEDSGITIHVGGYDKNSVAQYYLEDVSEVVIFMRKLLEAAG